MLSQNPTKSTQIQQLLNLTKQIKSLIAQRGHQSANGEQGGDLDVDVDKWMGIYGRVNQVLGMIGLGNVIDVNLLISKRVWGKDGSQDYGDDGGGEGRESEDEDEGSMYEVVEEFVVKLVTAIIHSKNPQKIPLLSQFLPKSPTVPLFQVSLIWSKCDRNSQTRSTKLSTYKWINARPLQSQTHNTIFYHIINTIMDEFSKQQYLRCQMVSVKLFQEVIYVLVDICAHGGSGGDGGNGGWVRLGEGLVVMKGVIGVGREVLTVGEVGREYNYRALTVFKKNMEDYIKSAIQWQIQYQQQIIQFSKFLEQFFNDMGLKLLDNQSVEKRLAGLRLIGCSHIDEANFFEWMGNNGVFQLILRETEKEAFVNNSGFIFKIVLKHMEKDSPYIPKIIQYLTLSKPQPRKCTLKHLQKFTPPQNTLLQDTLTLSFLQSQKYEHYTQELFDLLLLFIPKISPKIVQQILHKFIGLYCGQVFVRNRYVLDKCQAAVLEALGRVCERRGVEDGEKLGIFLEFYKVVFEDPINHEKIVMLIKITDKIQDRYNLPKQTKQKLLEYLFIEQKLIKKCSNWIKTITTKKDIEQIQSFLCSLLVRLNQNLKNKLISDLDILTDSIFSFRVFRKILSLQKNVQTLKTRFKSFISTCYTCPKTDKTTKCLRHYFSLLNTPNLNQNEDLTLQTKCIASELEGMTVLTDVLMNSQSEEEREDIGELLADLYVGYQGKIRDKGDLFVGGVFREVVDKLGRYLQWGEHDVGHSQILGLLALVKHLMLATQIQGVGKYKSHNSLVTTNMTDIKITNDLKKPPTTPQQRLYQKTLPANLTLIQLLIDVSSHFQCDIFDLQLKDGNKTIPPKYNGLTLEELKIHGKKLRAISSNGCSCVVERVRERILGDGGKLTPRMVEILTGIFQIYAVDGVMTEVQCANFVSGITQSNCSVKDNRVISFFQDYDDDEDGRLTLANFLAFYEKAAQDKDEDVWKNLKVSGIRYDLREFGKPMRDLDEKLLFRTYLNNPNIFYTLICLSKSQNPQLKSRSTQILLRLPSQSLNYTDLQISPDNTFLTQYFLISLQSTLQSCPTQQQKNLFIKSGKPREIFAIMCRFLQKQQRDFQEEKCVLICLKILRVICEVGDLRFGAVVGDTADGDGGDVGDGDSQMKDQRQERENQIGLAGTGVFMDMVDLDKEFVDVDQVQSLFALQLAQVIQKTHTKLGIEQALKGVCHHQPQIQHITCNYILSLSNLRHQISPIFTHTPSILTSTSTSSTPTCTSTWFDTLSTIITLNPTLDLQKIYQCCLQQLCTHKQTIEHVHDEIIYGNLGLVLAIARRDRTLVSFSKIVGIGGYLLSVDCRRVFYGILGEVGFNSAVFYVKELVSHVDINPALDITPKNKYIGLNNLGSTCYINSVLQLLYWIPKFRNELIQIQLPDPQPPKQSPKQPSSPTQSHSQPTQPQPHPSPQQNYTTQSQILSQTKKIFLYLHQGCNKYYQMSNFCKMYKNGQMQPIDVRQQQDAHQFSHHFLEVMEACFGLAGKKGLFEDMLRGHIVSEFVCGDCGHRLVREESYLSINLEVRGFHNLTQSLNKFTKPQQIQDYTCESCSKKIKITKYTKLTKLPQYLIINLNRILYDFQMNKYVKISSKFQFAEEIDLRDYMPHTMGNGNGGEGEGDRDGDGNDRDGDGFCYRFKAAIVHSGTCQSGHYYPVIRINQKWYKFDDKNVIELTTKDVQNQVYGGSEDHQSLYNDLKHSKSAYILCYQLLKPQPQQPQQPPQKKFKIFPELAQMIKQEREYIVNWLKICNDAIFQFCIQMFRRIVPEGQDGQREGQREGQGQGQGWDLGKCGDLFQLSIVLFRFLDKFWKLSDPTLVPELGRQICHLLCIIPEKSAQFLLQTDHFQATKLLCLHPDPTVKLTYRHILTKALHISYNTPSLTSPNSPYQNLSGHLNHLIQNLKQFFNDPLFYENIYQMQEYVLFWKICIECIEPVQEGLVRGDFLGFLLEILGYDSGFGDGDDGLGEFVMGDKRTTVQVLPSHVARVISSIVEKLVEKSIQMGIDNLNGKAFNIRDVLSQNVFTKLTTPELYVNIIKNNYDDYKVLGSVIAKLCQNNEQFSKQMAEIFLKGFKKYEQNFQMLSTMLSYLTQFLSIIDPLLQTRMKWIIGIAQLALSPEQYFGFPESTQSSQYNYISTLYFSQFDKYKPILHLIWLHSQFLFSKQYTVYLFQLVLRLCQGCQWLLGYLWALPSPGCAYGNYFWWLQGYLRKIGTISEKYFMDKKEVFLASCQSLYQKLKQNPTLNPEQPISTYFIIGKRKSTESKYELSFPLYSLNLFQHETYILKNQPTGTENLSLSTDIFETYLKQFFVNRRWDDAESQRKRNNGYGAYGGGYGMIDNQFMVESQKTMYTLEVQSESSLRILFNLEGFQEEVYVQSGKNVISFPYEPIDFKQVSFNQVINITPLNTDEITWSNRKYSHFQIQNPKKTDQPQSPHIFQDEITDKKSCTFCTYLNNLQSMTCEICGNQFK